MLVSTSAKPSLSPMAELQDNSSDSDSAQSDGDEGGSEGGLGDEDEGEADRSVASTSRVILANGRATKVKLTGGRAKKYGCTFEGCNKSYSRPVRLEEHLRSHTGEVSIHSLEPRTVLWGGPPQTNNPTQRPPHLTSRD